MSREMLTLEQVESAALADGDLQALAGVYTNVFAGPPWNEYTQCPAENRFYGRETQPGQQCPNGDDLLVPAYPLASTAEYIRGELARPAISLYLLRREDNIVGFSWGFAYPTPQAFASEKYKTPEMQARIAGLLGDVGLRGASYYLSESGILDDPSLRGRGLSRAFHERRLAYAQSLGLPALQRTSCDGPMYRTSLVSGMRQIMGPEAVVDTRARTITRTGRVVNNFQDTEIESRVLFAK